jgi:hypothetical protein
MVIVYGEEFLAPHQTPKLEYHPLSAVRDCIFNLFAAIPPPRKEAVPPSATVLLHVLILIYFLTVSEVSETELSRDVT